MSGQRARYGFDGAGTLSRRARRAHVVPAGLLPAAERVPGHESLLLHVMRHALRDHGLPMLRRGRRMFNAHSVETRRRLTAHLAAGDFPPTRPDLGDSGQPPRPGTVRVFRGTCGRLARRRHVGGTAPRIIRRGHAARARAAWHAPEQRRAVAARHRLLDRKRPPPALRPPLAAPRAHRAL